MCLIFSCSFKTYSLLIGHKTVDTTTREHHLPTTLFSTNPARCLYEVSVTKVIIHLDLLTLGCNLSPDYGSIIGFAPNTESVTQMYQEREVERPSNNPVDVSSRTEKGIDMRVDSWQNERKRTRTGFESH